MSGSVGPFNSGSGKKSARVPVYAVQLFHEMSVMVKVNKYIYFLIYVRWK